MKQDVLTRELQLEIVKEKDPDVEDLRAAASASMQEYFKTTSPGSRTKTKYFPLQSQLLDNKLV